ncbi:MAG: DUF1533 domain-containing protein [Ruminococcaceae bacterium]|nr:DUF1533 domain-containing protein [Oscillospiraceae bacterium]
MKKIKKIISSVLATAMLVTATSVSVCASSPEDFHDFPNDWSAEAVGWMLKNDLLKGSDGKLSTQSNITRAEMAAVLSRALGLSESVSLSAYSDIDSDSWYYDDMSKAVAAGLFNGDSGKLLPNEPITREQAFTVMARAYLLKNASNNLDEKFSDRNSISDWATDSVSSMVNSGYVSGSDGKLNPKDNITRSEFSQLLYNMVGNILGEAAVEDTVFDGNVMVNQQGTSLKNVTINGDLVLADSIDSIKLDGVTVYGRIVIRNNSKNLNLEKIQADEIVSKNSAFLTEEKNISSTIASYLNTPVTKSSGGSGSSSSDSSASSSTSDNLINRAVIADLGWSQFVVIQFGNGITLKDSTLYVDGKDVTSAFSPVTDDGSIAKWEITSLNPAKLTVNAKNTSQTAVLSNNANPTAPTVVKNTSPGYMTAHGPMQIWDYYLTVYDEDGAVRTEPSKTTFSLNGKSASKAPASYSPVAEISENGTGEVEIMFNYNQDWEKEWFNAIENKSGSVQLVSYDENQNTINSRLSFTLNYNVPHGSTKIGSIIIPLGQDNFRTNGRYYVRVRSKNNGAVLVPIHVVNAKAPTMRVTAESDIRSGEDVTFVISDMVYGIKNPTYAAELTDPNGKTTQLEMITDWYQIGPYLYLYNSEDAEGIDRNKIPYKGEYTLTVYSDGFKDMQAKFYVSYGAEAVSGSSKKMLNASSMKYDAVSSATTSAGSSGSSGGGGQVVSADVKFNADLLINAKIISEHLNIENEAAAAINDRWRSMHPDTVSAAETKLGGFDWDDYYAAVSSARSEGKYLSFAQYSSENSDLEKITLPHAVKSVLENNLLGDIQYYGSWVGKDAPSLLLAKQNEKGDYEYISYISEGENMNLICFDKEYISKITDINLNGNSQNLIKDLDYEFFVSGDGEISLIVIHPKTQSFLLNNANNIEITAKGYKLNRLRIRCEKPTAEHISVLSDKTEYYRDENGTEQITFTFDNTDFLKYLSKISVTSPSGTKKTVLSDGTGGTSSYYYSIKSGNELILADKKGTLFAENGEYRLTFEATDYYNSLSHKISVNGSLLPVPNTNPIGSRIKDPYYEGIYHYYLNFGTDSSYTLYNWKNAITEVSVNGEIYSQAGFAASVSRSNYSFPVQAYSDIVMELYSKPGYKTDSENTLIIKAIGYEDLTLKIDGTDGTLYGALKEPPLARLGTDKDGASYEIIFDDTSVRYLDAVTALEAGGKEISYNISENKLVFSSEGINGNTTLTVKAEGYNPLTLTATETPEIYSVARKDDTADYYRISFSGSDSDVDGFIKAITSVKVGNKTYKLYNANYYLDSSASYAYKKTTRLSSYAYIDLTADGVEDYGKTEITIKADGYRDINYVIDNSEVQPLEAPTVKNTEKIASTPDYYFISFDENENLNDFLKKIKKVVVNEKEYTAVSDKYFLSSYNYITDYEGYYYSRPIYLLLTADGILSDSSNNVTVYSRGYSPLTFEIK